MAKEEKDPRKFSLDLSDMEVEALNSYQNRPPWNGMPVSRKYLIRSAIMEAGIAPATTNDHFHSIKEDIEELHTDVKGILSIMAAMLAQSSPLPKRGRPPIREKTDEEVINEVAEPVLARNKKRLTDEEKYEDAIAVCDSLGGRVANGSCYYKKHEVTAAGRAVSFEIAEPLANVGPATVAGQYEPSREEWERVRDGFEEPVRTVVPEEADEETA